MGFWMALSSVLLPATVEAGDFDRFIGFVEELEGLAQDAGVSLPISSQQARDVKGLVLCLENAGNNDVQIALCIDQFHATGAGSGISQQTGIPSWVWDMLDCYIYYRTGDYWSLAYKLGEAAVCLVLQVVTGGSDICGLIEELIKLANAVWDAANAIAQFFVSVGEAAYGVVKDVGCALGLGGCDDGPSSPPEAWVYALVFSNRLADGLAAREALDAAAFDHVVNQLKQNALHKPEPILSAPPPPDLFGSQKMIYGMFTPGSVEKAADIYIYNVNIQWTADIASRVLAARSQTLNGYNTPQHLDQLAHMVLQSYTPRSGWNPQVPIINRCAEDLRIAGGYVHVDRWLQMNPVSKLGPQADQLRPTVKSNYELAGSFYNLIKNDLAVRVRQYVISHYCQDLGGKLVAQTLDKHRNSLELLKPFHLESQCYANTNTCGIEARNLIIQEFKKKGTRYYGEPALAQVGFVNQTVSFNPLVFTCYRPTHEHYFDHYYNTHFGDLPRKLLERVLKEEPAYMTLKAQVKAAVDQLNSPKDYIAYGIAGVDPLLVTAASFEDLAEAESTNTSFNFGPPSTKPGFEYSQKNFQQPTIDGRDTPLMYFDTVGSLSSKVKALAKMKTKEKLDFIDPTDPITENGSVQMVTNPVENQLAVKVDKLSPQTQVGQVDIQSGGGATQPMSGTLPPGQVPAGQPGWNTAIPLKKTPQKVATAPVLPLPLELPDLTANAAPMVNHIQAQWNTTVDLSASTASQRVPLGFTIQNQGKSSSTTCHVSLTVSGKELVKQPLGPMAPGEAMVVDMAVDLSPGLHPMVLMVDSANELRESNEGNNRFQITLKIQGKGIATPFQPVIPKSTTQQMTPLGR